MYGKGVYFARDASYSTYPLYSPPDAQGWQTVFAVRCVVGEWSQGVRDGLTPGVRDDSHNSVSYTHLTLPTTLTV